MEAFRSKTRARRAVCVRTDDALRFSVHFFFSESCVIKAALGINYYLLRLKYLKMNCVALLELQRRIVVP